MDVVDGGTATDAVHREDVDSLSRRDAAGELDAGKRAMPLESFVSVPPKVTPSMPSASHESLSRVTGRVRSADTTPVTGELRTLGLIAGEDDQRDRCPHGVDLLSRKISAAGLRRILPTLDVRAGSDRHRRVGHEDRARQLMSQPAGRT